MLRQVPCVMEMQTVEMLMSRLREDKAKEAFVLDEYGKFVGLVTLERLLGEMVGILMRNSSAPGKRWNTCRTVPCAFPA